MRIISVEAKNFRSYNSLNWSLPSNGLFLIDGENLDTGRNNMTGKCFAKGTPVLMFNGTIKPVEDVLVGDEIMGPDSLPRKVVSLGRGTEEMFEVIPSKGESYTVNRSHILSLKWIGGDKKGQILNITVNDYLSLPKNSKRLLYGYRTGVEFKTPRKLPIDPYFIGLWLGDGSSQSPSVTTADPEIVDYLNEFAKEIGQRVIVHGKAGNKCKTYTIASIERGDGKVLNSLIDLGLLGNKHIPFTYKTSSRADRLKVLAGLLDSDGYLNASSRTSFEYVTKSKELAEDFCYLARSLGFSASKTLRQKSVKYKHRQIFGNYYIIHVGGNLSQIPCKIARKKLGKDFSVRNPMHTAIKVESRGIGDYYGFEISGPDRLFLLGDFTVVHNTTLIDSIFWSLYGYLPKWGGPKGGPVDAVIKRGEKKCAVQVNIEFAGKHIFVRRERPNKLFVEVDGIVIEGKSSDLDDRIPELIGMTAEQFLTSVYVSQDRKQSFFTMNEADRTQLLSQISKVENINRAMEKAKKTKSDLELAIEKQKSVIQTQEAQLNDIPRQIAEVETDWQSRRYAINKAQEEAANAEAKCQDDVAKLDRWFEIKKNDLTSTMEQQRAKDTIFLKEQEAQLAILEAELIQAPRIDFKYTQKIEDLKKQIAEGEASNLKHHKANADLSIAKAGLNNCLNEIESAQNGKCDHCNQELPNHMKEKHVNEMLGHAKRWEDKINAIVVPSLIDIEPLKAELSQALQDYAKHKAEVEAGPKQKESEIKSLQIGINLSKQQLAAIEKNYQYDLKNLERELDYSKSECQKEVQKKLAMLDEAKAVAKAKQAVIDNLLKQSETYKNQVEESKIKLITLQKDLDQALDLIDVFKGFRQVCFEDLIARISDRAGYLLQLMTDGIYTTRIDQMGETSKGEAKLILKPMITKGGQDVPLDDLSGGARRTVMLAYDVAVAEAVGESSVLFLDEAMDGLDHQGKTEAMKLLEEVSRTKAVLVIDHSSEIKSAFQDVIRVTYKNETSHLEGNDDQLIDRPDSRAMDC